MSPWKLGSCAASAHQDAQVSSESRTVRAIHASRAAASRDPIGVPSSGIRSAMTRQPPGRIDLQTGAVVDQLAVVDAFELDLTFETPHHYVVAQKDRAFVLDPPARRIVEVILEDGMSLGRSLPLDAATTQLTLAGG
jgi:hypothetical protein